jgi:hypothetical protein
MYFGSGSDYNWLTETTIFSIYEKSYILGKFTDLTMNFFKNNALVVNKNQGIGFLCLTGAGTGPKTLLWLRIKPEVSNPCGSVSGPMGHSDPHSCWH